ncbi:MAG: YggT family protein [Clostridia bacterium]|nr:YggT family protein [Clostridia bacterium]
MGIIISVALEIMGEVLTWAIVVHALLTWFVPRDSAIMRVMDAFIEPVVAPFRMLLNKIIRRPMMIDFAPLLAMLVIPLIVNLLQAFVLNLFI